VASSAWTPWTTGSEKRLVAAVGSRPTDDPLDVLPGDGAAAAAEDARLREYAATRDPALREEIVLAYLGLADRLAMRFRHSRGTSPEDLTQTARAGLVAAVDRFDPERSTSFVPFAVASVVGELKRYLRDTSWRLHVPRPRKERVLRLQRVADQLHQALGRSPTTAELADELRLTEAEVLETLEAAETRIGLSLDGRAAGDELTIGDLLAAPGPQEEPEDLLALADLIAGLPELERQVVVMRYFHDLKQSDIAARIGYSQMHVSRLLRRALARMRVQLVEL
jgi:RNA polymerase sigma-B factor